MRLRLGVFLVLAIFGLPFSVLSLDMKDAYLHTDRIVIDPQRPNILYAAFFSYGIYKTTDQGKSWFPVNRGLKNTSVFTLEIDPKRPAVLYAGTYGGGIYKSEDAGGRWREINRGLTSTSIFSMILDPEDPNHLIAATAVSVFETRNGGELWKEIGMGLKFDPNSDNRNLFFVPQLA